MAANRTEHTANKYRATIADTYDKQREGKLKWSIENRAVTKFLSNNVPTGNNVLDCPCGTGRFIKFYSSQRYNVNCVDISEDMLEKAELKRKEHKALNVVLEKGSILNLWRYTNNYFHTALAIRIVNLLEPEDMQIALRELQRVSSNYVLFNIRIGEKGESKWRHPQSIRTVIDAVDSNWFVRDNIRLHEDDFRLLVLENKERS